MLAMYCPSIREQMIRQKQYLHNRVPEISFRKIWALLNKSDFG